jgi:UMF1 family MFS transporter
MALFALPAHAQSKFTLSGVIKDKKTGEGLIGAIIKVADKPSLGMASNEYGFYSLTLPDGDYTLVVNYFGFELDNHVIYEFVYSFALAIVVLITPILSGVADYLGNKKRFLQFFCYLGSLSCMSLFFFNKEYLELSFISFIFATIGFWGSLVYYNSYLPEIVSVENQDKVSARGFALGYFGSSLLLIICLVLVMTKTIWHFMGDLETNKGIDVRVSFLLVGIWWMGFAQYTFANLPNKSHDAHGKDRKGPTDAKTIIPIVFLSATKLI